MAPKRIAVAAVLVALGAAVALPASASAAIDSRDLAVQACAAERGDVGKRVFRKRYGKKPMRKCVRRARREVEAAVTVAVDECNAEVAEFGLEEFLAEYGPDPAAAFEECTALGVEIELSDYFPLLTADEDFED